MSRRVQLVAALVLPTLHFVWCLAIQLRLTPPSEGSWTWFPVFLVDLPFSMLPLLAGSAISNFAGLDVGPFVLLGLSGTIWWYFLSRLLLYLASRAIGKGSA